MYKGRKEERYTEAVARNLKSAAAAGRKHYKKLSLVEIKMKIGIRRNDNQHDKLIVDNIMMSMEERKAEQKAEQEQRRKDTAKYPRAYLLTSAEFPWMSGKFRRWIILENDRENKQYGCCPIHIQPNAVTPVTHIPESTVVIKHPNLDVIEKAYEKASFAKTLQETFNGQTR